MKLLVFGKSGQVATELARRLPVDVDATFLDRGQCDLGQPLECGKRIRNVDVDVVINAAAWTAVDRAEEEEAAATVVNGDAPAEMASACYERDIPLVHISTDYVFDGSGEKAFQPHDETSPINAYGRSKLAGEIAIQTSGATSVILRTSWVYSSHGNNFLKTMLKLGQSRDSLNVVSDQVGGPTPASAIADAAIAAARGLVGGQAGGIYHFSGTPEATWASFARAIMQAAELGCEIHDVPTSSYPTPARRPLNSRLDCSSLERDFKISQPDWQASLPRLVEEISASSQ